MDIVIRQATIDDLEIIQQFGYRLLKYERENWDPTLELDWPFSEEGKAKYTKAIDDGRTIIAEIDGMPVGFLIGSVEHPKPEAARKITTAQLQNIFVDEKVRGHGVGEKMTQKFKEYCLAEKVDKLSVVVNSKNTEAINFYKKIHFLPSLMILSQNLNG